MTDVMNEKDYPHTDEIEQIRKQDEAAFAAAEVMLLALGLIAGATA